MSSKNTGAAEPKAKVLAFDRGGVTCRITLRISPLPTPPLAPAGLYRCPEGSDAVLELHKVVRTARSRVTFETYDAQASPLQRGEVYIFRCWWAPWQLEVAQDATRVWQKKRFTASDAVASPASPRGRGTISPRGRGIIVHKMAPGEEISPDDSIIVGGWEHEHCALCWQTISALGEGDSAGYTDGTDWICGRCFHKYIASGLGPRLG